MSATRKDMHQLQELVRLHRMGTGAREVARLLGVSPNTERDYRRLLDAAGVLAGDPRDLPQCDRLRAVVEASKPARTAPQEVSTAADWTDQIRTMMSKGARPKSIYDTLKREESAFQASYWAVKRLCQGLKDGPVEAKDVAIPVTTKPGEQAQVDFGYVGRLYDPCGGVLRKAWVFVMTLSHSRHQFCQVVFDQRTTTWLELHVAAFRSFGGVPRVIRPDNLKAAVIRASFGADTEPALNRSYRELARHFGFKVDPTPPRQPQKKGKVESGVKYVKCNFFAPLKGALKDIDDCNARLGDWVEQTAGTRTHGTTGWAPLVEFEATELPALLPLSERRYELTSWKKAKVHSDSHFVFERRTYPVPWRFISKTAWLRVTARRIEVYIDDERIIGHERGQPVPDAIIDRCLPRERAHYRHRGRRFWIERAEAIDLRVARYIRDVFDSDDELSMLRAVQSIVTMLEKHPVKRAVAACERAAFFGNYSYKSVRNILRKGLDLEPLPTAISPAHGTLENPRYARTAAELLQLPLESLDEQH